VKNKIIYKKIRAKDLKFNDAICFEQGDMYTTLRDLGGGVAAQDICKAKETFLDVITGKSQASDEGRPCSHVRATSGTTYSFSEKEDIKLLQPQIIEGMNVLKGDFIFIEDENVFALQNGADPVTTNVYSKSWIRVLDVEFHDENKDKFWAVLIDEDDINEKSYAILFKKGDKAKVICGINKDGTSQYTKPAAQPQSVKVAMPPKTQVIFEGVNRIMDIDGLARLALDGRDIVVFEANADTLFATVEKITTENRDKIEFVEINDLEVEKGLQEETVFISFRSGSVKFINDKIANQSRYF
jgi:hypothetical protein